VLNPTQLLKPRAERLVAAIDVGTSKVAALIAMADGENAPRVIGAGVRASNGLKRGLVADMAKTEGAIRAAMMQAEKAAGLEIESVVVNLSAGELDSEVASVEIDIAGHRIAETDIAALLEAGRHRIAETIGPRNASGGPGRSTLHAEPTLYTIDGLEGVTNPRGFHADRLAVDIHVLTAATPPCRNLDLAVRQAHLDVEAIVASGVAASASVLNPEERELGVALIEIGAGVTTIAVHDRLFGDIDRALRETGFEGAAGRQVVLTGGGAELRGIADFAQGALARNVRIGRPRGLAGLPDAQSGAAFATLAGLVLHAATPRLDLARLAPGPRGGSAEPPRSAFARLFQQLKRQI
jgi:cell division ATPase FtsA